MLDYEEQRIWKREYLLKDNETMEDGILTSIWEFSSTILAGILDLVNGTKRPNWTLDFQLKINFLKYYLQQKNNKSLSRARKRLDMVKDWIGVSDEFTLENLQISTSFQELILFESAPKSTIWIIPEEDHKHTVNYSFKGEFLKLKKSMDRKVILYLHGGAYVLGNPAAFRNLATKIAKESDTDVLILDYRLAPEYPFPAALHDVLAAYLWLLNPKNSMFSQNIEEIYSYKPENIYLGGDSAGGGLVMCFLNYLNHYIKYQNGVPMPGAAFMFSPWVDLSMSSNSLRINSEFDYLPRHMIDLHEPIYPGVAHPVYSYILGHDHNRKLQIIKNEESDVLKSHFTLYRSENEDKSIVENYVYHPLISPVFESDFSCLPPILIQSGECEMLRDETLTLAYKISISNNGENETQSKVRHELYKDMVHVFQVVSSVKSSQVAIQNVANFLDHARLKGHLDGLLSADDDFCIVDSY